MTPFTRVAGPAVAIAGDNIDTDVIFPARFLLITARTGLGRFAFHDRPDAAAALDRSEPVVLVGGSNFGCGSSREQAVWALADRGIRAVVAPSFGEIFAANCVRNGVLPLALNTAVAARFAEQASAGATFAVDLTASAIDAGDGPIGFVVPPAWRDTLLNGWDETEIILRGHSDAIAAFEAAQRLAQPWLWRGEAR